MKTAIIFSCYLAQLE